MSKKLQYFGSTQSLDAVTVAWLAQLTTTFGTNPTNAFITPFNTWIAGMRTDGDLLAWDRLCLFGGQEVQGYSRVSILNPGSTQIVEVNTPTWGNSGYTFNGVNRYLNTGFNPSTHAVNTLRNSITHFVYVTSNVAENRWDTGWFSAPRDTLIASRFGDGRFYGSAQSSSGEANAVVATSLGLFAAQRTGSGDYQIWRNGAQVGTASNADNTLTNCIDIVGGMNTNTAGGIALSSPTTRRVAAWGIGSGAINMADFYTRFQTLATALSFNV